MGRTKQLCTGQPCSATRTRFAYADFDTNTSLPHHAKCSQQGVLRISLLKVKARFVDNGMQVAWLLDEGLELEARDAAGSTPLHCAVFYMQRAVIKLFLSHGADISTRDNQVSVSPFC